jgi:phosphoribosylformylglycinamidine (FGAM) synthase PurS component
MSLNDNLNPAARAIEQQIAMLEKKIDDLKAEYILFFNHETKAPPEKKREDLEKAVHKLIYGGAKTSRMDMLIQNLAQRFNLYNNLWLKKLNEMEAGTGAFQKKRAAAPPPGKDNGQKETYVTLNDEETFERLVDAYRQLLPNGGKTEREREKLIEGMKAKMLSNNLVEARVTLTVQNGKLSIRIKK